MKIARSHQIFHQEENSYIYHEAFIFEEWISTLNLSAQDCRQEVAAGQGA